MACFGWIGPQPRPPAAWDLRQAGMRLCPGNAGSRAECRHVLLADVRGLDAGQRLAMARADRPAWRLILIGVEAPAERVGLLELGCAEAPGAAIGLAELAVRARRINQMFGLLPRWRSLGPVTLDLFHRDARHGACWLGLNPREFGLLWRLADSPGAVVTRRQLLEDVWRLRHIPETNSLEVHVSRLRAKLARAGCAWLVETAPQGGYRICPDGPFMLPSPAPQADALDACLGRLGWPLALADPAQEGAGAAARHAIE